MTPTETIRPQVALVREVIELKIRMDDVQDQRRCVHLNEILSIYKSRKAEQEKLNRKTSFQFNPLRKIQIHEPTHSQVLGDLLDPQGSHGQGNLFLQEFLKRIDHPNSRSVDWQVTVETGRVDICLRHKNPKSVIIIENKSNGAIDQQHQLYRYWYRNIHCNNRDLNYSDASVARNFKVVYMAPSKRKLPEPQSLACPAMLEGLPGLQDKLPLEPVCFTLDGDLPDWFAACIPQLDPANERLRHFLKLYQEIWSLIL